MTAKAILIGFPFPLSVRVDIPQTAIVYAAVAE
jgi:hypothetical protein